MGIQPETALTRQSAFAFGTANGPAADPSIAGVPELGPLWREVGEHRTLGGFYPVLPGGR
jgi:hypothetical protein